MADKKSKEEYEEEELEYITLEFDDGESVECEVQGVFDAGGKEYIALLPEDGTDDVYIYGYKEVGDDEYDLLDLDDDEFKIAVDEYEKIIAEEG